LHNGEYRLSPEQAQAILELRLHRLTGLEHEKLINDYQELIKQIAGYLEILGSTEKLMQVIRGELEEINNEYGDDRKTEITSSTHDLTVEDLITEEDRVVTISRGGYAKSQPLSDYQAQRRGGMGKAAASVKDEDFVEHLLVASTHDTLLCFTSSGKVFWLKVFQMPLASRTSRGKPIINILPLEEGEQITSMLPIREYEEGKFIFMATTSGTVKKTPLVSFSRQRSVGLKAIELEEGDTLIKTAITDGTKDVMLYSSSGKVTRFNESNVRAMGRTAKGVRGIRLDSEHRMVDMIIPEENGQILAVSENGYGKRTVVTEFPTKGRGGKGVIGIQASARNGQIVGAVQVFEGDEIMLISDKGTLVRTRTEEVSSQGRATQGVRLIKLKEGELLVGLACVDEPDVILESEDDEDGSATTEASQSETGDTTDSGPQDNAGEDRQPDDQVDDE
jgi:DNA gyrase subunit A